MAGVNVKLIIRGMMSLITGKKDTSDNIKGIGIVDRFLEHTRFMLFCNGGHEECYITSADLMTRNVDRRIEVTCPVFDRTIKNELKEIFQIQWNDNVKARKLDANLSNKFIKQGKKAYRSQVEVFNYLKKIHEK